MGNEGSTEAVLGAANGASVLNSLLLAVRNNGGGATAPVPRRHLCFCDGAKVYVWGHDDQQIMFVMNMSPAGTTGTWRIVETRGEPPSVRSSAAVAVVGRRAYVFGGVDQHHVLNEDLFAFDFDTHTWFKPAIEGNLGEVAAIHAPFNRLEAFKAQRVEACKKGTNIKRVLDYFNNGEARLVRLSSPPFHHETHHKSKGDKQNWCRLCARANKGSMEGSKSMYTCSLCKVPLCIEVYRNEATGEETSCWKVWHTHDTVVNQERPYHRKKRKIGDDNAAKAQAPPPSSATMVMIPPSAQHH